MDASLERFRQGRKENRAIVVDEERIRYHAEIQELPESRELPNLEICLVRAESEIPQVIDELGRLVEMKES